MEAGGRYTKEQQADFQKNNPLVWNALASLSQFLENEMEFKISSGAVVGDVKPEYIHDVMTPEDAMAALPG